MIARSALLGVDPSPAWAATVDALCPGASTSADHALRVTFDMAVRHTPARFHHALAGIIADLSGRATTDGIRAASESLRAVYEAAAPPRVGQVRAARHMHAERWRWPWTDPCDDPAELRPLAACVTAVYAVEAWATGQRVGLVAYYLRAAWDWSAAAEETAR